MVYICIRKRRARLADRKLACNDIVKVPLILTFIIIIVTAAPWPRVGMRIS